MKPKTQQIIIHALGHPNVQSSHPTTLMITKDRHLSENGDCIVAVAADKALSGLDQEFKEILRKPNSRLTITIETGGVKEEIHAAGSPKLCLCHATDIVIRKSSYICTRTLAISADKASLDLSIALIKKLRDPTQKVTITLRIDG